MGKTFSDPIHQISGIGKKAKISAMPRKKRVNRSYLLNLTGNPILKNNKTQTPVEDLDELGETENIYNEGFAENIKQKYIKIHATDRIIRKRLPSYTQQIKYNQFSTAKNINQLF